MSKAAIEAYNTRSHQLKMDNYKHATATTANTNNISSGSADTSTQQHLTNVSASF